MIGIAQPVSMIPPIIAVLVNAPAAKRKRNTPESAVRIRHALATAVIGVLGRLSAIARATIPKIVLPVIMETDIPIRGITAPAYATMY